jgi:hypothetical protein
MSPTRSPTIRGGQRPGENELNKRVIKAMKSRDLAGLEVGSGLALPISASTTRSRSCAASLLGP